MNNQNTEFKHYTVGFYFTNELDKVLLIRKAKPQWQMGRLNGIGGAFEIEDMENSSKCMAREFGEETGQSTCGTNFVSWSKFSEGEVCVHQGNCFLHYMVAKGPYFKPVKINTEECIWLCTCSEFGTYTFPIDVVPNLHWLIPMALLKFTKPWWSEIATFRTLV